MYPKDSIFIQDYRDLGVIFLHAELDDYGLTASEFRLYAHMARRAGTGEARSSIPSMAAHCKIAEKCVRRDLKILVAFGLIGVIQKRPGKPTIYGLLQKGKWATADRIEELREKAIASKPKNAGKSTKSTKSLKTEATLEHTKTETKQESDSGKMTRSPSESLARNSGSPARSQPYPSGPWLADDGDLDKNFVEWLANEYSRDYGHSPYKAAENVKRSFINNPDKLSPCWERYHKEMAHLTMNLKLQEERGIDVSQDKKYLEKHQKGVLNPEKPLEKSDYWHSGFLIDNLEPANVLAPSDPPPLPHETATQLLSPQIDITTKLNKIKEARIGKQEAVSVKNDLDRLLQQLEDPLLRRDRSIQLRCKMLIETGDYQHTLDKDGLINWLGEFPF